MKPDKQHLSRNLQTHLLSSDFNISECRAERRETTAWTGKTAKKTQTNRKSTPTTFKQVKGRQFVTFKLSQAGLQSESDSSFSATATDNSTIVWIARQLDTRSKNVSLLCFLYTKRCLFHSYWANTGPSDNQRRETHERKEVERRAAEMKRWQADKRRTHKGSGLKRTQESGSEHEVKQDSQSNTKTL